MKKIILFLLLSLCFVQVHFAQTNLWGMTMQGGAMNFGEIFKTNADGTGLQVMYSFTNGTDGGGPQGSLTTFGAKLYGMTFSGGAGGGGVLFEFDPLIGVFTKKVDFMGVSNGSTPFSLMVYGTKLYGTTWSGGTSGNGVLFEYDPLSGVLTKKIDFIGTSNGAQPYGSLCASGTKLYGMTSAGGTNNQGVLFEYDPSSGVLVKKIDFNGTTNGGAPRGSLTLLGTKLYGMTTYGPNGTLFEYDPSTSILTKKVDFNGSNGAAPHGSLTVLGTKLYGLTLGGGAGTLFEYDPATSILTKKIDFNGINGAQPYGSLTVSGTKLYGLASAGGASNVGNLFEFDPASGILTTKTDFNGINGSTPMITQLLSFTSGPEINLRQVSSIASGGSYNFGNVNLPTSSGAISFTIENTGGTALNLTGTPNKIAISGTNASDFSINQSTTLASVAGGSNTTFTINFTPSAAGTRTAAISIANNDIDENPYIINLSGTGVCPLPAAAGGITGLSTVCSGATGKVYSIVAVSGATGYNWTVPTGATITAGANTNSITVNFGSASGNINVVPTNSCGNGTLAGLGIVVNALPVTGAITGLASVCSGATNQVFSVTSVAGATYAWTVPAGASIVSGQGSSSITVNFGTSAGNISVTQTNSNGCVGAPASLAITIKSLPNNALVVTGPTAVCASKTNNVFTVSNPTAGATYNWTVPTGASIVSGQGTSTLTANWGTTAGSVTVSETNTCGTGTVVSKAVTISSAPNNALVVTGPTAVCVSKTNNVFTVTNPTAGATYNWTVPVGASIVSGQGTATLTANWGTTAGSVTVSETNTCGTGTVVSKAVSISAPYALGNVDAFCGGSFCVPLKTTAAIANGIIGIDFAINYNSAVVTPTGIGFTGPVATTYGSYYINTSTPGKAYVSVALNNAPNGTYFSGTGDIICVSFTVNAGAALGTAFTLSTDGIEESTPVTTNMNCQVLPLNLTVNAPLKATLLYRNTAGVTLNYDPANPSAYVATTVTGVNASCAAPSTAVSKPDLSGLFQYSTANGVNLKIQRDVSGDLNVPVINCTNVQSVINSVDRIKAWEIATFKVATPTIYALLSSDVNLDGKVTAGDVSLISSRSINGNNCEFPQANYTWNGTALVPAAGYVKSQDWLFVDDVTLATTAFTTGAGRNSVPKAPNCMPAPTGTASCAAVSTATYHAILLGDVDGNWTSANGTQMRTASSGAVILDLSQTVTNVQGNYLIPVYYQSSDAYSGMDFSIDYHNSVSIQNVSSNSAFTTAGTEFNNIDNQRLMVTSYSEDPLNTSGPISYIEVSSSNGKIKSSDFSNSQAYLNGAPVPLKFSFDNSIAPDEANVKVFPNPFNTETFIYAEDEAAFVKVTVVNVSGVTVYENDQVPSNEKFKLDNVTTAGVYFVKVVCTKGTVIKKLIKL